ncbi:MAG: AAA family ATPase [Clostridia bacterium]|nr:AAA family ATPase [Clostridia bacterium]
MSETRVNMPILSVEKTIKHLSNIYCEIVKKGISPKVLPSVMLWGPPGVGKSQAIRQIAKDIKRNTGKETRITDVRLLLFNPIDLRGIPTSNADKTLAIWLKPQIFQMDPSDDIVNILFLDEISAAPQSVQAAAYQITLDRVVGEHKLPDNCIIIAAGNRVTDKSVSFKMPKALANRLLHIEVEGSFESWQNWAVRAGVNPKVIGFLSFRTDRLFGFDPKSDDLAFATPRSWEMVSNLLNNVCDDVKTMYPLIAGLIGSGLALEFRSWCKLHFKLPNTEDIFMGKRCEIPKSADTLYAIVSSMTNYAKEHKDDAEQIGNSLSYASGFPADFVSLLIENYENIEENYKEFLMQIPEYYELSQKRGRVRNGQV